MNNNRIESLDSIRGLASLAVVIHHTLLVLPLFFLTNDHEKVESTLVNAFSYTPLHMIWGGHEAVMLFFILSGFVLSLPFYANKNSPYPHYIIKRICRIYIPYILSMGISIFLFIVITTVDINSLSDFFKYQWSHPVSFLSVFSYLFMLDYDNFNINGVTWSLIHEMRISFIFPFIMIFIIKYNWKRSLFFGIIVSLTLWALILLIVNIIDINSIEFFLKSIAKTCYYTAFFIIGAVFAKHRFTIIDRVRFMPISTKILGFIVFILLYNFQWISFGFGKLKFSESIIISSATQLITDYAIATSVILLFALVLSSNKFQVLLSKKPLTFLGKISYSLYLVHSIVLLAMIHLFYQYLTMGLILVMIPVISLLTAVPYYYFVEKPSMKIGKYLTSTSNFNKVTALKKAVLKRE